MKLLWFVNVAMPPVLERMGLKPSGSGWWLTTLADRLRREPAMDLTIAYCDHKFETFDEFAAGGVRYWVLPAGRELGLTGAGREGIIDLVRDAVQRCDPDLVEVRGTERSYGLATPHLRRPVLVNIQGLINAVAKHPFGRFSLAQALVRMVRSRNDLKWGGAMVLRRFTLRLRAAAERRIFELNRYFTGRTAWDQRMTRRFCPNLRGYYACPEMLREPFFTVQWSADRAQPRRLFTCGRQDPYKGLDDLLWMLARFRTDRPDLRLRIAGGTSQYGWPGYLMRLARRLGVADRVEFLGYLSGEQIAEELSRAAVYLHPSYVDNSPNTLAEAQCVGTPSVATRVGGIPSLVEDGRTGLLYRAGDIGQLCDRVGRLLDDSALAARIGGSARDVARRRHDPGAISARAIEIYRAVIEDYRSR